MVRGLSYHPGLDAECAGEGGVGGSGAVRVKRELGGKMSAHQSSGPEIQRENNDVQIKLVLRDVQSHLIYQRKWVRAKKHSARIEFAVLVSKVYPDSGEQGQCYIHKKREKPQHELLRSISRRETFTILQT